MIHFFLRAAEIKDYYWSACGKIIQAEKLNNLTTKDIDQVSCSDCKKRLQEGINNVL